jgi:hypothetical protein
MTVKFNLSTYKDGKWIWNSVVGNFTLTTPQFPPQRLTHSYNTNFPTPAPTEEPSYIKQFVLNHPIDPIEVAIGVVLMGSLLANFGGLCHHVVKSFGIAKNDTKIVRRWLKISASAGKTSLKSDINYNPNGRLGHLFY